MSSEKYSYVFWDWNGTLLNDLDWGIYSINKMLERRNLKVLNGVEEYHKVFCFPIIQYYLNVGLDLEREVFEELAVEYMSIYHGEGSEKIELHTDAEKVLSELDKKGALQVILSASDMYYLNKQLSPFDITKYFKDILGINDIYAKSKIEVGLDYMSKNSVTNAVMIGDSVHDYEVSQAMGIDCILVSCGHQSREKLMSCKVPVLDNLHDILNYFS